MQLEVASHTVSPIFAPSLISKFSLMIHHLPIDKCCAATVLGKDVVAMSAKKEARLVLIFGDSRSFCHISLCGIPS